MPTLNTKAMNPAFYGTGDVSIVGAPNVSPAIITSKAATTDLNNIKNQTAEINTGIQTQAQITAQKTAEANATKVAAETERIAKEQKDKELKIKQDALSMGGESGIAIPTDPTFQGQINRAPEMIKSVETNPDGTRTVYYKDGQAQIVAKDPNAPIKVEDKEAELERKSLEFETQAQNVQTTIDNIQNGTVPLSAGELAQIEGLKQQFQQLIDSQNLTNTGASGTANIRGYQTGAAEYDPSFQVRTIGSIITAGQNKIADLNIKMASAVASLTQGFKDNKINSIKDAWSIYSEASKARTDALTKTIERANAKIKEAKLEKEKADKIKADLEKEERDYGIKVEEDINKVANDASINGAPLEVIAKIGTAQSVIEATMMAGEYLQKAKDPLEQKYKQAQIDKIYQDIATAKLENSGMGDPNSIIAYAQQYAADGKIPSGMPKGSFGVISQIAKELPKQKGQIIDTATGVAPVGDTTLVNALAGLSSVVDLGKQLKELDKERWGGIVSGTLGKVFGNADQQRYVDLRDQIIDLLARARTGAALTTSEEKHYAGMLPDRFSEPFGLGVNSDVRIDNFINAITSDLDNKARAKGWSIYGLSTVDTPLGKKTVGETIEANGVVGRVNADGTVTLIE
jgi:hypothetical protein